jgi:hypothetical protein
LKAVLKYFERYAEPETALAKQLPDRKWSDVLVVPARRETDALFHLLRSIERAAGFSSSKVLTILVVNGTEREAAENQKLFQKLEILEWKNGTAFLSRTYSDLFVIDRASPPRAFQEKQGVGLARKIGCDIALALIRAGRILSPWMRNTDADVILPEDYFLTLETHHEKQTVGFVYDFFHNSKPLGHFAPALDIYDLSLRYYVSGLRWAQSPYAFHTIGSALVVHANAYAEVRGFPKREAGEDFYLLNKLAKIGHVESSLGSPIQIQGRLSDRTPFGTGARVNEIASDLMENRDILFYHPQIFDYLREWLEVLSHFSESLLDLESLLEARTSGRFLIPLLKSMGAIDAATRLKERAKAPEVRLRNIHVWFDAFKTLKFVHGLRDTSLPSLPWREAVDRLGQLTADDTLRYKASEGIMEIYERSTSHI